MVEIIKRLNTIVYKKICTIANPNQVKQYYDSNILEPINLDSELRTQLFEFFNFTVYPNYLTDRMLELVVGEFQEQPIPLNKLQYVELFESIGKLNKDIGDILIQSIMGNSRGTETFVLDNNLVSRDNGLNTKASKIKKERFSTSTPSNPNPSTSSPSTSSPSTPNPSSPSSSSSSSSSPQSINLSNVFVQIILHIDKLKISSQFINFIRFLLANIYSNSQITPPSKLGEKIMLFERYGELPMRQFLCDLRIEKRLIDTNRYLPMYTQ